VANDFKQSAFASSAHDYVTKLFCREGLPVGDEQGTPDRPYFLTVIFAPASIDAIVNALGRTPWMESRPRIVVILGESKFSRDTVLTTDSDVRFGQPRGSRKSAADWELRNTIFSRYRFGGPNDPIDCRSRI